jgi:hypothetical protein
MVSSILTPDTSTVAAMLTAVSRLNAAPSIKLRIRFIVVRSSIGSWFRDEKGRREVFILVPVLPGCYRVLP